MQGKVAHDERGALPDENFRVSVGAASIGQYCISQCDSLSSGADWEET